MLELAGATEAGFILSAGFGGPTRPVGMETRDGGGWGSPH